MSEDDIRSKLEFSKKNSYTLDRTILKLSQANAFPKDDNKKLYPNDKKLDVQMVSHHCRRLFDF